MSENDEAKAWIMGLASLLVVSLLLGSYVYTFISSQAHEVSSQEWKRDHEAKHERDMKELKDNQRELMTKMENSDRNTASILTEVLAAVRRPSNRAQNTGQ